MSDIGQRLWNFCHTLRHEGIGYTQYIEQITYLLFLKMADEKGVNLPTGCDWQILTTKSGEELLSGYTNILATLGRQSGILGDIFTGAQSLFRTSANLKRLLNSIDETEWTLLDVDVKAKVFEDLLERAASEGKKGAGQMFTPRPLIRSIVRCIKPDPRAASDFTIGDPACGTGGFLVSALEWFVEATGGAMDRTMAERFRYHTYYGQEIDLTPRRLALMNLYLHKVEPHITLGDSIYETYNGPRFDVILSNPPFGVRGANQSPSRDDFTVSTSNKQLNFVQHILSILKEGGRAAVVLPDNCLFADQAGEVFKILMEDCDLHTVLRLPRGTFTPYAAGVKTNVVFFTKGMSTQQTWIYDGRTNVPGITKKDRPLTEGHFAEFEGCFGSDPFGRSPRKPQDSSADRWRCFSLVEVRERDFKFDSLRWLKEESLEDGDDLPEPEELMTDALGELRLAMESISRVLSLLDNGINSTALSVEQTA